MDNYKELFKVVNGATLFSMYIGNLLVMFEYKPIEILIANIIFAILVNLILLIICWLCG